MTIMERLLPGIKESLCNQIRVLIESMAADGFDGWDVGDRVLNSMRLHLDGAERLIDADYDMLVAYYQHLRGKWNARHLSYH